jgi:hypothetical protein
MGLALFGHGWTDALAEALGVTEEDVADWERDPASRPANLQDILENLGLVRIQEIQILLPQMKGTGAGGT